MSGSSRTPWHFYLKKCGSLSTNHEIVGLRQIECNSGKYWEEVGKIFLKKFAAFSIFYWVLSCPRCEREDQVSFTMALGRGEVIPLF